MKTNKIALFFLIIVLLFGFSCKKDNSNQTIKTPVIIATINPYYLLTKELVGDKFTVKLFIPANASPHTFSPTPAKILQLEESSLVIANGLGLEKQFEKKLLTLSNKLIVASDYLPDENKIVFDENISTTKTESTDIDPHIWLEPQNLILIAQAITKKLISLEPQSTKLFDTNLKNLITKLTETDKKILAERNSINKDINIIVYHKAFQYFCKKYKINIVASIESFPGQVLSPKELLDIGKLAMIYTVKAIYTEPQLNQKSVNILAKEYNLSIGILDPLGFSFKATNVCDILVKNWEEIKKYQ